MILVAKFKEDMKAFAEESGEEEANQEEAAEAFAAFAAPESGEARKADILAKLAAAYDTTKNKKCQVFSQILLFSVDTY